MDIFEQGMDLFFVCCVKELGDIVCLKIVMQEFLFVICFLVIDQLDLIV